REINNTKIKIISSNYEEKLIKAAFSYLKLLSEFTIEPPMFIFLSFLGVKNYRIWHETSGYREEGLPIDRELLLLPEGITENYDTKIEHSLKPLFDLVWNASGYQNSLNFDKNGNWIVR
ncbi:MAG: hypothetical protein Q8M34_00440, partial [Thermodesulfovibrionales bacterium]|nr:hypothetical protein [Thermodesulfovibrionales bacterium]